LQALTFALPTGCWSPKPPSESAEDVAGLDPVLDQVEQEIQGRTTGAVIATHPSLADAVTARISSPAVQIVVGGDEWERCAALTLAISSLAPERLSDAASDRSAERLRQLSDEVSRIASTLARLSTGPSSTPSRPAEVPASESPDVSADTVRSVIRARRLRARFFSEELFADPAWDMLLDLLQAEIAQLRVPVSSLCIAASVPATTALRWLKTMTNEGLFLRRADPHDGRRVFVELAPHASQALRRYFAEVGKPAVV
jgi:DNA-binding MarR family transcriptional regulator